MQPKPFDNPARLWTFSEAWLPVLMAVAAATAPSLLAYNLSPSPTFLNQALALGLWAAFVLSCAPRSPGRCGLALWIALGLVGLGVLWSWGAGALPAGLALSALGLLFAAVVVAAAGSAARRADDAAGLFAAFATAWVVAGLLNVLVACLQVFAPGLADGDWLASSNLPGRAVGNLRQPNHLSSLLLWSVIATVALVEMRRLSTQLAAALLTLFVFGIVLTASRTGVVSVVLLAVWGLADRRLAPRSRLLLLAAPLVYAAAWGAMAQWAAAAQRSFGGVERIAEDMGQGVDYSSSRFAIWSQTLSLLEDSPWLGVGYGEFNYAWTLTAFPNRPKAFFDHTHNLPLHLAVELGLPLAAAVMALLLYALWRAARRAWAMPAAAPTQAPDEQPIDAPTGAAARASVLFVVMIGLHSLLEYPLWYAYFLLPAAWAWGFALGEGEGARAGRAGKVHGAKRGLRLLNLGAAAVVLGAALSVIDYTRVTTIFSSAEGAPPLAQRIESGRRSLFFSHHADYAAVTSGVALGNPQASFASTTHYLLDNRLIVAWSEWLAAQGELDLARHLAARLREFRSPEAEEFFAACPKRALPLAEAAGLPFQCQLPQRVPHWREFLRR